MWSLMSCTSLQAFSYPQGFGGEPALLTALAAFFNTFFGPCESISSEHLVATAGASACLDSLLYSICDEEDFVMVPAPYWSGYPFECSLVC